MIVWLKSFVKGAWCNFAKCSLKALNGNKQYKYDMSLRSLV